MSHSVVVAASDQVVIHEVRALVGEVENHHVVDVAADAALLEDAVVRRDPDVVLVHASLGPAPVLHTIRDITLRRPGVAVILLTPQATPDMFSEAMDAGARGVLAYPTTLEDLQSRLAAAVQWATQMRRHLSTSGAQATPTGRARVFAIAGSKGGVGTSTLAAHLAHHHALAAPGRSVCLVDLDLEKGDLGHLMGVSHRLDVSDLAKVADDLGPQSISSAIHRGEDGIGLLLAPNRIEDVGHVDERETRVIVGALRQHFDTVIVDVGSHPTPATTAAVEVADEVVLVTTPEVLALRGVHRILDAWSRIGVRKPDSVKLVLNRVSRTTSVQPDTAARLVPVAPLSTQLPAAFKQLEPGLNHRSPAEVRDRTWWRRVAALSAEVGVVEERGEPPAPRRRPSRRRPPAMAELRADRDERGQATLEFTGMFPLVLLLAAVVWQVALMGATFAVTGHAADEAARAAALDQDVAGVAKAAVPDWIGSQMTVTSLPGSDAVRVSTGIPLLVPGVTLDAWSFTTEVGVVDEG